MYYCNCRKNIRSVLKNVNHVRLGEMCSKDCNIRRFKKKDCNIRKIICTIYIRIFY